MDGPHGAHGPHESVVPMGPWDQAHSLWGRRPFGGIHFKESDLSFEQNLNCSVSVKQSYVERFPWAITRTQTQAHARMVICTLTHTHLRACTHAHLHPRTHMDMCMSTHKPYSDLVDLLFGIDSHFWNRFLWVVELVLGTTSTTNRVMELVSSTKNIITAPSPQNKLQSLSWPHKTHL